MPSRHVLLQPRWIVAHVMVLMVVVTFPLLGLWQLDRYDQERDAAARLEAELEREPVPIGSLLDPGTSEAVQRDLEFRPVTATGTYAVEEQVLQRNREFSGAAGFDALTPLVLEDGTGVLVRRGWVPTARPGSPDPAPAPAPDGSVTVSGYLERSGSQPGFGPKDPADGTLTTVFHADVARIDQQSSVDLLPMVLHLLEQDPAPSDDAPRPQPPPQVDASQNLSYAVQWFLFTAIAIVGYAVVVTRKRAEHRAA